MLKDDGIAKGSLHIVVTGHDGKEKQVLNVENLVVTVGLGLIAAGIASGATTTMGWMAVGTNATAASLADTTLGTEVGRVALTSSVRTGSAIAYVATFPAGTGTGTLVEAGLFSAAVAGSMLSHSVFSSITKAAGDTVSITWTITIG